MPTGMIEWKDITPDSLLPAISHIRERFDENEFKFDFLTRQKCYKELHPVAQGTTPSRIFNDYLEVYRAGLEASIDKEFNELLEIGLANAVQLKQHPVDWAQLQLKSILERNSHRVALWIKNVCDQQPLSNSTTPEEMDEFVHWRSWRAPKFIVMQPSAKVPYNSATAWERENEEQTQKYLHGLSERFRDSLIFRLDRLAGESHVTLAKKGTRIQQPLGLTLPRQNDGTVQPDSDEQVPVAFISYSWDSEDHKNWVLALASRLQQDGVRVILDRWHLERGGDRIIFMEQAVTTSKFVVLICTPNYATRANNRSGGVGYESTIITAELAENINQRKFIPILRAGDWRSSVPVWIKTKLGVDLAANPYSPTEYADLLRTLHGQPLTPPSLGPKPIFAEPTADQDLFPQRPNPQSAETQSNHGREAVKRKLSIVRIHALHPQLTIWITNRSDFAVSVKSVSLWHRQRLNYGVPSENRRSVEIKPHVENAPIAFLTDHDAMLKLQSTGIIDGRLPTYSFIDGLDIEIRIELELLEQEDEYRETLRVRTYGNRQIESL